MFGGRTFHSGTVLGKKMNTCSNQELPEREVPDSALASLKLRLDLASCDDERWCWLVI